MGLFLQTAIIPNADEKTARAALEALARGKDSVELDLSGVPGADDAAVRDALETLARSEDSMGLDVSGCRFSGSGKGVQVLFNDHCMGYERLAEALSRETGRPVLLLYIYDDDFWGYFFCEDGVILDQFMPIPEYFSDDPAEAVNAPGNAALIAERFHVPAETVAPYLTSWALDDLDGAEKAFEADEFPYGDCWQMVDFMAKLGWPWPWD